jgi:hypothetical protein
MDGMEEVRRAVSGKGPPVEEAPREAQVLSQVQTEATEIIVDSVISADGPNAIQAWEENPDTPVIMPNPPLVPQGLQPIDRSRPSSRRSRHSEHEERRPQGKKPVQSRSRSRTSSAIDSSSHHSRREVDLFSSDVQQQRKMRSSGQRTNPASLIMKDGEDPPATDGDLGSQSMSEITAHVGGAFPEDEEVEDTAHRPNDIDFTLDLPTPMTSDRSSTGSTYRRKVDR